MSLGHNVLKLLSSKVATQVIALVTAPIIARLFLPEHFGVRQIFMSIAGVITVITCLRYELSIPLGKNCEANTDVRNCSSRYFNVIY